MTCIPVWSHGIASVAGLRRIPRTVPFFVKHLCTPLFSWLVEISTSLARIHRSIESASYGATSIEEASLAPPSSQKDVIGTNGGSSINDRSAPTLGKWLVNIPLKLVSELEKWNKQERQDMPIRGLRGVSGFPLSRRLPGRKGRKDSLSRDH